jgi:hypothetical protein
VIKERKDDVSASGMQTVLRGIERRQSQSEICYEIAQNLRGEINSLQAEMFGPVTSRPRKKEQESREARISGMKTALGLALGIPPDFHLEALEQFLGDFRKERLRAIEDGHDDQAERRRKALAAEKRRIVGPREGGMA